MNTLILQSVLMLSFVAACSVEEAKKSSNKGNNVNSIASPGEPGTGAPAGLAAPEVVVKNLSAYGWTDNSSTLLKFDIKPAEKSSGKTKYMCRYGRIYGNSKSALVWDSKAKFTACDMNKAEGAVAILQKPNGALADGSYRLEVKAVVGDEESPVATYDFYMHRSLNSAKVCSDFASADSFFKQAAANPYLASAHKFGNTTSLDGALKSIVWADGSTTDVRSLRKRFERRTVNGVDLVLVSRSYPSLNNAANGCYTNVTTGLFRRENGGKVYDVYNLACQAVAFNADGHGYCLNPLASSVPDGAKKIKQIKNKFAQQYKVGQSTNSFFSPKILPGETVPELNLLSPSTQIIELNP